MFLIFDFAHPENEMKSAENQLKVAVSKIYFSAMLKPIHNLTLTMQIVHIL